MKLQFGMAKITATRIPSVPSYTDKKQPIDIPQTNGWAEWVTTANNLLGLQADRFDTVQNVTVTLWKPEDNPQALPRRRNGKFFTGTEITITNHQGVIMANKRPIKTKGERVPENKLVMITKPEGDGTNFTTQDNALSESLLAAGAHSIEASTTPVRKWHNPKSWFKGARTVSYSKPRS